MNIILLEVSEIAEDGRAVLSDTRALHIRNVLHAKPGDTLRVGVINGPLGTAEAVKINDAGVELCCTLNAEIPPRPPVDLLLALPRPKVMKRLWAQLAALGVGRILLTNAWKVERNYFDTHVLDPEFYRPLLIEGLQQAQDTRLPEVSLHKQFKKLIEDDLDALSPDTCRLIAEPGPADDIRNVLCGSTERLLLAVGPEGGWTEYESSLLKARGFKSVGMGPRTLRTDTACIALLAVAHSSLLACRDQSRNL